MAIRQYAKVGLRPTTTRGESSAASAPIIAALTSLSDNDRAVPRKTFDIVFYLAQEKLLHCTTHNTVGDTYDDDSDPETECFEMLEEWDHLVFGDDLHVDVCTLWERWGICFLNTSASASLQTEMNRRLLMQGLLYP